MGEAEHPFPRAGARRLRAGPPLRWGGPLLLAGLFALLAAWSWGKWPDPLVDFGSELYVPWQLASGKRLYRDIAYRQGPLPHHVNALWFALFGVSLRTLVVCNLAILAGICALAWRILERGCGALAATAACAVLLAVFGFSQYVGIGNYNFATPYQHHQTHGLLLGLLGILALSRGACRGSATGWAAAGTCLGFAFLTKLELFLPLAGASGAALALCALGAPGRPPRAARGAAILAAAALLPPLAAVALLARAMPPGDALDGALGNWVHLGGGTRGSWILSTVAARGSTPRPRTRCARSPSWRAWPPSPPRRWRSSAGSRAGAARSRPPPSGWPPSPPGRCRGGWPGPRSRARSRSRTSGSVRRSPGAACARAGGPSSWSAGFPSPSSPSSPSCCSRR
jgi:hypothetical protein